MILQLFTENLRKEAGRKEEGIKKKEKGGRKVCMVFEFAPAVILQHFISSSYVAKW